jgi:hypothetical protein
MGGDCTVLGASTASDGTFEIHGALPKQVYHLSAGGNGLASIEPEAVSSENDITIIVHYVYGATVRRVDTASLTEARITPEYCPIPQTRVHAELGSANTLRTASVAANLCLPPAMPDASASVTRHLYTSHVDTSEVGPITLEEELPGYNPARLVFYAAPASAGHLPVYDLRFEPNSRQWGRVRLQLIGHDERWNTGLPRIDWARLHLEPIDRDSPSVARIYILPEFEGDSYVLDHVERGSYSATFEITNSTFHVPVRGHPPILLDVGAQTAEILLDVTALSFADILVSEGDGSAYGGPLSLLLGQGPVETAENGNPVMQGGGHITFDRPPYRITGLEQGQYSLWVVRPALGMNGPLIQPFEVAGMQPVQLRFDLPE